MHMVIRHLIFKSSTDNFRMNHVGIFQSYYAIHFLASYSASEIAFVGSVQNFLVLFVGFLSGPLYDAGYASHLLLSGVLLTVLGTMALSLAHHGQYYHVFLSQAICVGLGWGLMFTPTASIPSRFFKKRLPLAAGLASAGTGVGGIVYSIAFSRISQTSLGFPWATRTLGFLALTTLLFSISTMCTRAQSTVRRRLIDCTAFQDRAYNVYLAGGVLTMIGLQAPYYYASLYATEVGVTSTQVAFYVVTAMNGGSCFGRLVIPFVALLIGVFDTFILAYIATCTACLCLISARSNGAIFAVATLYGFFSGGVVALSPVTLMRMTPDPTLIGTRIGMTFAISSIGVLVGSPICGAILNTSNNYTFADVWIFSGTCIAIGAVLMLLCRVTLFGVSFRKNV
ncbi:hypothetical protein AC578_3099 [Pseudocercospora eumusae]|uniref:Major facilitator superfamily (MFS) profile domain-containing protein n=1 Tax=Pseudocercospora eumusae TaxID=321146 RepID=A0A139GUZ3_9PEZI|nr:hypothetical protein AC578_3099 [Pseudocercospora eumusae]